jgi:hypothetical protein
MIELHAWARIWESYEADNEGDKMHFIKQELQERIANLNWKDNTSSMAFRLGGLNGELYLCITAAPSHRRQDIEEVFDLYNLIAKIAPGSYGLVYMHDDEDKNGMDNAFRVFVLTRGVLREEKDPFLSPYFPTLEDYDIDWTPPTIS